ncbi:hypothetical protein VaNZ11_011551 [Volvox africanus]|uniref:Protein root UVB sensitive/RUS domain-containing protein n=1 Tax=Volvox africanus TaxID=51714 RepID=A0ABQ5SDG3_9CHLO|nr:hypothetical protein VaNZ11_011551 [Volvox africanus]
MPKAEPETELLMLEYHRGHLTTSINLSSGLTGAGNGDGTARTARRGVHRSLLSGVTSLLRAAFLPEGYPESVSPDYLSFQMWDTIQALSSYVRGVLTSQAILKGVGVGQQASSPLAAVFTFFLRDLAGMLGGILFAYLEGSSFDSCAKQWRLFADIINDLGMTLELASPLFPRVMFLPIACLGSIARSLTGVAGGATRAALTQHFARRGNAADVSAKEQSQETATTILGMVAGMAVTRLLAAGESTGGSDAAAAWAWAVFLALTVLHVVANVMAMRVLLLTSLNMPRLELLLKRYLQDGRVLAPREVSEMEDLTPPPFRRLLDLGLGWGWGVSFAVGASRRLAVLLHYGSRLSSALRAVDGGSGGRDSTSILRMTTRLKQLLCRHGGRPYLLLTATSTRLPGVPFGECDAAGASVSDSARFPSQTRIHVHLVIRRGATTAELLRAFVHAHCLVHYCQLQVQGVMTQKASAESVVSGQSAPRQRRQQRQQQQAKRGHEEVGEEEAPEPEGMLGAVEEAAETWMRTRYDRLVSELQAIGWHIDRVALPRPGWTAEWGAAAAGRSAGGVEEREVHEVGPEASDRPHQD